MRVVIPQTLQQHTLTIQKVIARKGVVANKDGRYQFQHLGRHSGEEHYGILFIPQPRRRRSPALPAVQVSLTPTQVTSLFVDKRAVAADHSGVAQHVAEWLSMVFKQNIPRPQKLV